MTIKEKLETIKGKKIAIWVERDEQDDILINALNLITHEDCTGSWNGYGVCYSLDEFYNLGIWSWGNVEYYIADDYEIIKFSDFVDGINDLGFVELTQQDINVILNDKYGKYNWVIKQ